MNKAEFITQEMTDTVQKMTKKVIETGDAIADLYNTYGLAIIYNPKKLSFDIVSMDIYHDILKHYCSLKTDGIITITKKGE